MPTPDHMDNGAWRLLHQSECPEYMHGTIRYLENDVYKREICRGCGFESTELLDDGPRGAA